MPTRDFALNRTKVQMSTPFLRVRPWNFAHVCNVPLPSLLRMFWVFFSAKMWGPLKPKYLQKIQKPKYLAKKTKRKKKKKSLKARQGHIKHVCKISGSNSQKRCRQLASEGIRGFVLEPACNSHTPYTAGLESALHFWNSKCALCSSSDWVPESLNVH